ncbi:MAG TPA: hypothetical protein VHX86_02120 [Tepidisphaeraceae bacterium]|jgi:hypothetical protein|nr:hypothetical protein [Tepidisphaeraceae bacterium]
MSQSQVEELILLVSGLDKASLLRQFREYPASFPLDFTPDFLDQQPLERLRHLFVAVCLQCKRMPQGPAEAA